MNNAAMGIRFYAAKKAPNATQVGSGVSGGGSQTSAMRSGVGMDEAYFMVQRAKSVAAAGPASKASTYRALGGVAEQRVPDGNVLDTTYGVRVGGVHSTMEFDPPQTRINSDAVKVWDAQVKASRTFELDRIGEWTGRPAPSATS